MAQTVETFIATMVLPEYRPLVQAFRDLVRKDFPELKEEMRGGTEKYPGTPAYRLKRIVVVISPSKKGITYAFSDGRLFEDTYNMLEGVGNKTLNIRLKSIDEFDNEKMRYYVKQAVTIDSGK
jgi:hypothetical protein